MSTDTLLIPNTLFDFILNLNNIESFPVLNIDSIKVKRFWRSEIGQRRKITQSQKAKDQWSRLTEKQRNKVKKRMSVSTKKFFKHDPRADEVRRKQSEGLSIAVRNFWKNITPEKREEMRKMRSEQFKNWWRNATPEDIARKEYGDDVEVIRMERINDYSGIITESQMKELMRR